LPVVQGSAGYNAVKKVYRKNFTIYVPPGFIFPNFWRMLSDPSKVDLNVHIFFSAGDATNDMLVHGLRSASAQSGWITIDVPGSQLPDGTSIATPFTDADLNACMADLGLTGQITSLRLTGHSRGCISLVSAVASKKLTGLSRIDRVVLLDELSHGKVDQLVFVGVPRSKITGYQVNDATKHLKGVNYVKLPPRGMEAVGCLRLVNDGMALQPAVAAEVAADRLLKAQVDSISLPPRNSFTTAQPPPPGKTNLQDFCAANASAIKAICAADAKGSTAASLPKSHSLLAVINKYDLAQFGGYVMSPGIAAHHFFVAEIAAELYA
jgi:hypothetical protein